MNNREVAKNKFGQIYDQSIDRIYRFVYIKVNSREIAEDITSQTFTKVWKVFETAYGSDSPIDNPQAFCYRTARNLVIDYYKTKEKDKVIPLESIQLVDNDSKSIEEMAIINSDMDMVMKGIRLLRDDYQDVIIWRYLDELSISEIAKLLDKSEDATRVMIHRAMSTLRQHFTS